MKHDYLENIKYLTDFTKLSKVMYMNEKMGTERLNSFVFFKINIHRYVKKTKYTNVWTKRFF